MPLAFRQWHLYRLDFMAEDEGFEPPQTESESGVLPLHKSSKSSDNLVSHVTGQKSSDSRKVSQRIVRGDSPLGGDYGTRTCDLMRVKHAL